MVKLSRTDDRVTIGRRKISEHRKMQEIGRLLFEDDLVLLANSSESGLQHVLNGFAATCEIAGQSKLALLKLRYYIIRKILSNVF